MTMLSKERSRVPEEIKPPCDVVVVLGGNLVKTPNGIWRTTPYQEGDYKSIGAHARVVAAIELYKSGKAKMFIVSTGRTVTLHETNLPDMSAPTDAEIMKKEMVRGGIPAECIICEKESTTTLTNAMEVAKILKRHPEWKNVAILTSGWHLERAMVFCEAEFRNGCDVTLIPLDADAIVAGKSKHHKKLVDAMMGAPSMAVRKAAEQRGIQAFLEGKYKSTPLSNNVTRSSST